MHSRFWRTSQAVLVWYSAFLSSSQLPWNSIYRIFFIHFPSNQFKLERKYWIDCGEMWLLHSMIKYGNLAWPFIWGDFSLISHCRILIWEQAAWFCFPSAGVRKPLYLIVKKKNIIFRKKNYQHCDQCHHSAASQWLSHKALIPHFSSVQTDQWLAPLTGN